MMKCRKLGNGVNGSHFADDMPVLHYNKKSENGSQSSTGSDQQTGCMGSGKGLDISPRKTVSMVFRKRRKRNKEPIEIMLRNKIISLKESTHFLGMTLDSRLN